MTVRSSIALLACVTGFAAAAGNASAQGYPGGYRWGPPPPAVVYDEDAPPAPAAPVGRSEMASGDPRYAAPGGYPAPDDDVIPVVPAPGDPVYRPVPLDPADAGADVEMAPRPPEGVASAPSAAPLPAPAPAPADVTGAVTTPGAPAAPAGSGAMYASLPADVRPEAEESAQLPPQFRRQLVDYDTKEPAGTIVVDTPNTFLYLVLGHGKALRYGIGVGREGFTWTGVERIARMAQWPDWFPPEEMIERQPYLPRVMAGGPGNPLGARALYLGNTLYRIHGTNQPSTIGTFVSSGCIRLTNEDIEDLYQRVRVGTRVVVMPGKPDAATAAAVSPAAAARIVH